MRKPEWLGLAIGSLLVLTAGLTACKPQERVTQRGPQELPCESSDESFDSIATHRVPLRIDELADGVYEYVAGEAYYEDPTNARSRVGLHVREQIRKRGPETRAEGSFVCRQGFLGEQINLLVDPVLPRAIRKRGDRVDAVLRNFKLYTRGGDPFFQFEDRAGWDDLSLTDFQKRLGEEWDRVEFVSMDMGVYRLIATRKAGNAQIRIMIHLVQKDHDNSIESFRLPFPPTSL